MSGKRPAGVTIIAVLTFCGAVVLALSSFSFFLIAVMGTTSKDGRQPVSAAIDGMGVAGGFSLLVLASVAACLGDWGVEIARMGADRINRIRCRGYWVHDF